MANALIKSEKHIIIICPLKDDLTSEQYKRWIENLSVHTGYHLVSPHYVIDTAGTVLELIDPDYLGDATGIPDIDRNAISIVKIGKEPTAIQHHRLGDLLRDLEKRYPDIPRGKFWEEYKEYATGLQCSGIFEKDVFKQLEV